MRPGISGYVAAAMVHALGYSQTEFNAREPGRLCRGRERWIEPYEIPADWQMEPIQRLVVSGAVFSDDSAADALRGVPHSQVDLAALIAALFPRKDLLAFMEDGHPADIPDDAEDVELYDGYRAGGLSQELRVRWVKPASGIREIRALIGAEASDYRVRGFALVSGDEERGPLAERLFLLSGFSTLDSPPAQFQPAALPEVLDMVKAVILLHRDKNGPAVGVYSRDPVKTDGRLGTLCEKAGALLVRFAIPPMLARWDRALSEAREQWDVEADGEFPVPVCPEPHSWEPRRRRKEREKREAAEAVDLEEQTVQPIGEKPFEEVTDDESVLDDESALDSASSLGDDLLDDDALLQEVEDDTPAKAAKPTVDVDNLDALLLED